jgi:AcrR family transcriptional regulator
LHDSYVKSRPYDSPTRKAHAEATRLAILRSLVDLIVEEGPGTISIPQVAARAEVSVRTVYHYFPTKEDLFDGLTAAMPSLVATPDGGLPTATSPAELVGTMPEIYRFLAANERMFKALSVSELAGRAAAARREERHERVDAAIGSMAEHLDPDDYRQLRSVIGLLSSFTAYDTLTDVWGLSVDEAADVSAWATRVLCDRARRSGVGL